MSPHARTFVAAMLPLVLALAAIAGETTFVHAGTPTGGAGGATDSHSSSTPPYDLSAVAGYKGWTVAALRIEGIEPSLAGRIAEGLALSGESRLLGRRHARLFDRVVRDDLDRIRLFLARNGYPYATVRPRGDPAGSERRLDLTFEIEAGRRVVVAEMITTGLPEQFTPPPDAGMAFGAGAPLVDARVEAAVQSLANLLKQDGYPFAKVNARVAAIDSGHVSVTLAAEPGTRCRFGEVIVTGVSSDLQPLARKTVAAKSGSLYSPAVPRRAQQSLRGLGLFRQIRLDLRESRPGTVDILAELLPRKPRSAEIGVGYWTDDYLRLSARWRHRNLLRAGRGLELFGTASRFRQEIGYAVWWPALLGSRTTVTQRTRLTREDEEGYELINTEAGLFGSYRFSLATSLQAGIALSHVDVNVGGRVADVFVEEGGLLTILSLRWTRDSSNDRIYPSAGTVTWMLAEWAPTGPLSETHFVSLQASGSWYRKLIGKAVLASRLHLGTATPIGDSVDLLPNKRFYAGGPSSMRGAGRRKLGPQDADGAPSGGEAMALASTEIRLPLFWLLGASLFADAGQVWRDRDLMTPRDLEVAAGCGLMVRTPVGPIRADLALNITERPSGEPNSVLHISVGHPF